MTAVDLAPQRRFFADELDAVCGLQTRGLTEAFAAVERERFLPPGPWDVLSMTDYTPTAGANTRKTADADPRRVYHNIGIAIDSARRLFNGHPATLAAWIDALALVPGARVLHVGAGTGYYTAVMAHVIGATGRLVAIEVDHTLAATARANLASMPWVEVRHGDASGAVDGPFDAVLINAGVTHPREEWLDALAENGRLALPLTVQMMPTIGKGVMLMITRTAGAFTVRPFGMVAIYSAIGLRDDAVNAALADILRKQPWPTATRLRREVHEASASCWLHGDGWCLST